MLKISVKKFKGLAWWVFKPSTWRQRQVNLCELETSLVYRVSSRTTKTVTQRNPVLKKQKQNTKNFGDGEHFRKTPNIETSGFYMNAQTSLYIPA